MKLNKTEQNYLSNHGTSTQKGRKREGKERLTEGSAGVAEQRRQGLCAKLVILEKAKMPT